MDLSSTAQIGDSFFKMSLFQDVKYLAIKWIVFIQHLKCSFGGCPETTQIAIPTQLLDYWICFCCKCGYLDVLLEIRMNGQ